MSGATSRGPWGGDAPARGLLTLVAAAGAFLLLVLSPGEEGPVLPPPQLVVDPNTAPPEVLGALPKLGPSLVAKIVAAREEAPFQSLDDLDTRVSGIGPATIAALRPYLRIAPAAIASPSRRMVQNAR